MSRGIMVLVADEDDTARKYVAGVLESRGFEIIQAVDVGSAMKVLEDWNVDVAIISYHLKPTNGFEVAKHALVKNRKTGMIMLADNPTTDVLIKAGENNIGQVMHKPVEPDRLMESVKRILRARGISSDAMVSGMEKTYTHEELMERALALAVQNVKGELGGPFAAVVADKDGRILGEGVNSVKTRSDPTAHAEVLAIRRATDKIDDIRLDGCIIYCSSEPTMLSEALIIGTGIKQVYYGLSHAEAGTIRAQDDNIMTEMAKPIDMREVVHTQLSKDKAAEVFKSWRKDY